MSLTGNFDNHQKGEGHGEELQNLGSESQNNIDKYRKASRVRNICFAQLNGQSLFLNYAYLISGEYFPNESAIHLVFSTHRVILEGSNLKGLYEDLMMHLLRQITVQDKRYLAMLNDGDTVVTSLQILEV